MGNFKNILIATTCVISLCGLIYGVDKWNKERIIIEKFKKPTYSSFCTSNLVTPSAKISFNKEDGGIECIYIIDSIGQPQGEWHRNPFMPHSLEPSGELVAFMALDYLKKQPIDTSVSIDQLTFVGENIARQYLDELYCSYLYVYPLNENAVLKAIEISSDNKVRSVTFYNNFGIELVADFNPWGGGIL